MSVNGVGQNYYQNDVATTKSTKNVTSTEKATNINASQKNEGTASSSKQVAPEYANYTIGTGICGIASGSMIF